MNTYESKNSVVSNSLFHYHSVCSKTDFFSEKNPMIKRERMDERIPPLLPLFSSMKSVSPWNVFRWSFKSLSLWRRTLLHHVLIRHYDASHFSIANIEALFICTMSDILMGKFMPTSFLPSSTQFLWATVPICMTMGPTRAAVMGREWKCLRIQQLTFQGQHQQKDGKTTTINIGKITLSVNHKTFVMIFMWWKVN